MAEAPCLEELLQRLDERAGVLARTAREGRPGRFPAPGWKRPGPATEGSGAQDDRRGQEDQDSRGSARCDAPGRGGLRTLGAELVGEVDRERDLTAVRSISREILRTSEAPGGPGPGVRGDSERTHPAQRERETRGLSRTESRELVSADEAGRTSVLPPPKATSRLGARWETGKVFLRQRAGVEEPASLELHEASLGLLLGRPA